MWYIVAMVTLLLGGLLAGLIFLRLREQRKLNTTISDLRDIDQQFNRQLMILAEMLGTLSAFSDQTLPEQKSIEPLKSSEPGHAEDTSYDFHIASDPPYHYFEDAYAVLESHYGYSFDLLINHFTNQELDIVCLGRETKDRYMFLYQLKERLQRVGMDLEEGAHGRLYGSLVQGEGEKNWEALWEVEDCLRADYARI